MVFRIRYYDEPSTDSGVVFKISRFQDGMKTALKCLFVMMVYVLLSNVPHVPFLKYGSTATPHYKNLMLLVGPSDLFTDIPATDDDFAL